MLSAGCVHVSVVSPASFVYMDSATVDALELVKPMRPAQQRTKQATLLGLMSHTKTACGAKLLRVSFLALCSRSGMRTMLWVCNRVPIRPAHQHSKQATWRSLVHHCKTAC